MKTKVISLFFAAMLVMTLGACAGTTSSDTAGSSAGGESTAAADTAGAESSSGTDQTFDVGVQSLPDTLDAASIVSNAGNQINYNLYDTLIMRDTTSDEVRFLPGLATSWEQTDDLTWTIHLREGVKFHDGSTMTADDVAYSMNRIINEDDPSYMQTHTFLLSNFSSFEAQDDLTVIAHTINPEPLFENLLSDPNTGIISKNAMEFKGEDGFSQAPVTTGPYKVVSFDPGNSVVLERFDDFWGEKAPFEKVTFTAIPEVMSRITALQNGEVDFITNIPPDQESTLSSNADIKLVGEVMPLYQVYRINMSNPITDDPNLRAALNYSIDRQKLVDTIWQGKAEAATTAQFADYGEPLYIAENQDIKYDPDLARELLAESDYNGETIEIYDVTDYYTYADMTALAVIDMWKEIGINAELKEIDSQSSVDNAEKEMRTWSNPLYYMDPMGYLERHWSPSGESVQSGHFVPDEEYIAAFNKVRYSTDENERVEGMKDILAWFKDNTPFIYLFKPYESYGMAADVQYEIPKNVRAYTIGLRSGQIEIQ